MYAHPAFKIDTETSLQFASERGFGLITAIDSGKPVGSLVPFLIERESNGNGTGLGRIELHVARGNRLGALAAAGGAWLLAVQGDDTYVSPDWYASRDQVPTWLYQAVHITGQASAMAPENLPDHLARLSAKFEGWLAPKPAWTMGKLPAERREMLLRGIVGIEIAIESVEGSFKLNQHKADADFVAIAKALRAQKDPPAQRLGDRMAVLRPQLVYD